jgi:hypothetical protein
MPATRKEVLIQLDILRAGLRIANTTIRKLKANQNVDTGPILRKLAMIRSDAECVRDGVRIPK